MPTFVRVRLLIFGIAGLLAGASSGRGATELSRLPVKEVTIFKDGHAFVVHAGSVSLDEAGAVRLAGLPAPVLGTFWPFVSGNDEKLVSASAGREWVASPRTAGSIRELLLANPGAQVIIDDNRQRSYQATILGAPGPAAGAAPDRNPFAESPAPPGPAAGEVILLRTPEGTRMVPFASISEVTFLTPPRQELEERQQRDVLTLRLQSTARAAHVGMTYLQKGLRWIPQYRVTLQADGAATVELQATLLNELIDLDGVTAHLVIGVPTFQFQETLDPMALDRTLDELSAYFRRQSAAGGGAHSYLSNAIMLQTQVLRMAEHRDAPGAGAADPQLAAGDEDLFLFTLEDLTLRRGERMIVPVGRWTVSYEDLYRLKLPFVPPSELRQHLDNNAQAELLRLQNQPRVMHVARLKNTSDAPFTTAPALLMEEGRILAQGMMTYTSTGATVDMEITAAVNVPAVVDDNETGRTPNDLQFHNSWYQRVDLEGRITVTNRQGGPVRIEVERMVPGAADTASADGEITRPGWHGWVGMPDWLSSFSWPWWWQHLNPISRVRWTKELPAGDRLELTYQWHYFCG